MLCPTYSRVPDSYAACRTRSQPDVVIASGFSTKTATPARRKSIAGILVQVVRGGQEDPVQLQVEQFVMVAVRLRVRIVGQRGLLQACDGIADRDDSGSFTGLVRMPGQLAPGSEPHHTEPKVFCTHASDSCT